jgi:pyroglutamyl-peptidase
MPTGPLVIAAFEPFGGRRLNRSLEAIEAVPDRSHLQRARLPVDFARLPRAVAELLERKPRALLLVGEADDRRHVSVERVALNVVHARIPDNAGQKPEREQVLPGGPLAVEATWDAGQVLAALRAAGVRAELSHHAGTFACNASLFLAVTGARDPALPIGFLHVPSAAWPWGLRRATLGRAVEAALLTMVGAYAI